MSPCAHHDAGAVMPRLARLGESARVSDRVGAVRALERDLHSVAFTTLTCLCSRVLLSTYAQVIISGWYNIVYMFARLERVGERRLG